MCGRYTLSAEAKQLMLAFDLSFEGHNPRYNVAPSQGVPIIRADGVAALTWGLVPSWAKSPDQGPKPINARSETILEKPAFRTAFRRRRCLVPADGFFEWKLEGGKKHPMYFRMKGGNPFAFAGIWDRWEGPQALIESFSILTVAPNEVVAPVHDRMPAIMAPDQYQRWLDPESNPDELLSLLGPYPAERMEAYAVSPRVNSVRHDDAECLKPVATQGSLFG